MGLAVSRFWWPAGLARAFADQGFAVARYDQRDAGQSTRMPDTGHANPFVALARRRGGYSSEDMTDDAVAVLDALGWERAHIFGASLGGVIAQRTALRHPDRVLSVVSAMALPSDAVGIKAGRYVRFGTLARLARVKVPEGRDGDIQLSLALARELATPTTRSTKPPPASGSSARSTRARGTPRRSAGRSALHGTARGYASCRRPPSSCTATKTRSCASAPPATRPTRSPAPVW